MTLDTLIAEAICAHCEERAAACLGCYEDHSREDCPLADGECKQHDEDYACDECCGHANEDGHCWPLADIPGVLTTIDANARALAAERDALLDALAELQREVSDVTRDKNYALQCQNEQLEVALDEVETLKIDLNELREMKGVNAWAGEVRAKAQLAAMTAARNEACDWWERYLHGPAGTKESSAPEWQLLAELRKVGS